MIKSVIKSYNSRKLVAYSTTTCLSVLQRPTKPKNTQKPKNIRIQAEYGRLDLTQSQRNDDKHDGICQNMFVGAFIGKKRNTILVRSKALCGSLRRWVCCYETDRNISETNFMYC